MCRQCGSHYSPAARKAAPVRLTRTVATEAPPVAPDVSLRGKLEGFWKPHRNSVVQCFECNTKQEVSGAANSSICPKCSAHIDLKDYKISTSFSRTIRTRGEVHLMPKGELSSSTVICRTALIEGKLRGNLVCSESAVINYTGKILGRLTAGHVVIERRAEVQFFRRLRVRSIEVKGRMTGEISAETEVLVHKTGALDGAVTARAISVEKGGVFTGLLVIGSKTLKQAELLPGDPAAPTGPALVESQPPLLLQPLPAIS